MLLKYIIISFGEICERKKISKYFGNYLMFLKFFDMSLVFLSVSSVTVTVAAIVSDMCSDWSYMCLLHYFLLYIIDLLSYF